MLANLQNGIKNECCNIKTWDKRIIIPWRLKNSPEKYFPKNLTVNSALFYFNFQVPLVVRNEDDVLTAGSNQLSENIVPIFCISSVTGEGLELLTRFLHVLPPGVSNKEKQRLEQVSKENFEK